MHLHANDLKLYWKRLIGLFWSFVSFWGFFYESWDGSSTGNVLKEPPGAGGSVPDCLQEGFATYCHKYHLLALGKDERRIDAGKVIPAQFVFNMLSALFSIHLLLVMIKGKELVGRLVSPVWALMRLMWAVCYIHCIVPGSWKHGDLSFWWCFIS